MSSVVVGSGAGDKAHHHHPHQRPHPPTKNILKKTLLGNPQTPTASSCVHADHQAGGSAPKCVCAPATHAGSFKCRLHRVNPNGPTSPPAPASDAAASSTRTVEAL